MPGASRCRQLPLFGTLSPGEPGREGHCGVVCGGAGGCFVLHGEPCVDPAARTTVVMMVMMMMMMMANYTSDPWVSRTPATRAQEENPEPLWKNILPLPLSFGATLFVFIVYNHTLLISFPMVLVSYTGSSSICRYGKDPLIRHG